MPQNDKRSEVVLTQNRTSVDPAYLKYLSEKEPKAALSAKTRTVSFNNHVLVYVVLSNADVKGEQKKQRGILDVVEPLVDMAPEDDGSLYFRDNLITCHVQEDIPGFLSDHSYRVLSVDERGEYVSVGTECFVKADYLILDLKSLTEAEITPLWKGEANA